MAYELTENKATLYAANGSKKEVYPDDDKMFNWEEIQNLVGYKVEILFLEDGSILATDEHGKMKGLAYNEEATKLLTGTKYAGDYLVGNVLHGSRRVILDLDEHGL